MRYSSHRPTRTSVSTGRRSTISCWSPSVSVKRSPIRTEGSIPSTESWKSGSTGSSGTNHSSNSGCRQPRTIDSRNVASEVAKIMNLSAGTLVVKL